MKKNTDDQVTPPGKLLDLWLGGLSPSGGPNKPHSSIAFIAISTIGLLAVAGMALFAPDKLLLVFGIVIFIVVVNRLFRFVADSELMSPAWMLIGFAIIATAVWLLFPRDSLKSATLQRLIPAPVQRVVSSVMEIGWVQRLIDGEGTPQGAPGAAPMGASPTAQPGSGPSPMGVTPAEPGGQPGGGTASQPEMRVRLTCSPLTARVGEALHLTASVSGAGSQRTGVVRFFDGQQLMAESRLDSAGTAFARFADRTAGPGTHRFWALYVGPESAFGVRSEVVTVTVLAGAAAQAK